MQGSLNRANRFRIIMPARRGRGCNRVTRSSDTRAKLRNDIYFDDVETIG